MAPLNGMASCMLMVPLLGEVHIPLRPPLKLIVHCLFEGALVMCFRVLLEVVLKITGDY